MIDLLIYSGYFILVINLILYSFSFFRSEKANIFFVGYLAFVFIMQFIMEVMYYLHMNNLFAVNIFFIGQMIFLGLFYKSVLKNKKQKRFVKYSLITTLLVLLIQFVIDYKQFLKFNLLGITITSLIIVVFALLHFYNMLTDEKEYYYLNIGVVFYLFASTVLYLVGNLTSELSNDVKYLSWTLNALLVVAYYLFILFEWKIRYSQNKKISN
ncbi:hypothetical protein [Flavobacterium piscis]|uniref:Uncharacterized protein n=1 Tax=Flavobacterium piscis TaxID=1114874 RepID=A0ABU1YEH9_9FLAO|nr:hypothetical protein [Flavobacterium piscis]MDR7212645.1 hypothetical protein [Flavobacterium piscis]